MKYLFLAFIFCAYATDALAGNFWGEFANGAATSSSNRASERSRLQEVQAHEEIKNDIVLQQLDTCLYANNTEVDHANLVLHSKAKIIGDKMNDQKRRLIAVYKKGKMSKEVYLQKFAAIETDFKHKFAPLRAEHLQAVSLAGDKQQQKCNEELRYNKLRVDQYDSEYQTRRQVEQNNSKVTELENRLNKSEQSQQQTEWDLQSAKNQAEYANQKADDAQDEVSRLKRGYR